MRRVHETVMADGVFRVVLTQDHRVFAELHVSESPLGPLHLRFEVGPRHVQLPDGRRVHRSALMRANETAGIFDDIARKVSRAAEKTFNTVSKGVTTVIRPAFNAVKTAAGHGMRAIAKAIPQGDLRRQLEASSRIVLRARLGDLQAKDFMRFVRKAADAGIDAARFVARRLDDATKAMVPLPIRPFQQLDKLAAAVQSGNLGEIRKVLKDNAALAQGVVSTIPGIGTGISAGLGAGVAALEGGSPVEYAIRTAYGAIPIPSGIRMVTDSALEAVLTFAKTGSVTDAALAAARARVPPGMPRDVFDTLAQILVKKVPVQKAAGAMAEHYLQRYGGAATDKLLAAAAPKGGLPSLPSLPSLPAIPLPAGGGLESFLPRLLPG